MPKLIIDQDSAGALVAGAKLILHTVIEVKERWERERREALYDYLYKDLDGLIPSPKLFGRGIPMTKQNLGRLNETVMGRAALHEAEVATTTSMDFKYREKYRNWKSNSFWVSVYNILDGTPYGWLEVVQGMEHMIGLTSVYKIELSPREINTLYGVKSLKPLYDEIVDNDAGG